MISLVQDSVKAIINTIIKPGKWTVEDANGINNSATIPRVAFESTVLKHTIKNKDVINMQVNSAFQYQVNFRLDSRLKYEQLPVRQLTNLMSYLSFIFSTHPGLLEKTPAELEDYEAYEFIHVDPCLNDSSVSRYSISNLLVNSFIPVIEQSNNDWLMVLVFSFDLTMECKKSDYRQFFEEVLGGDLIPGYSGGKINHIDKLTISTHTKSPIKQAGIRVIE